MAFRRGGGVERGALGVTAYTPTVQSSPIVGGTQGDASQFPNSMRLVRRMGFPTRAHRLSSQPSPCSLSPSKPPGTSEKRHEDPRHTHLHQSGDL